ncbi:alanine--tRNA ligase [Dehalogenimonas etheniformans]|uniref:Alanine--tRNA ligase n=1 Tax=Dehalogenimonas etheniformans TaxID=1536648 RepID=A0A2P5P752_9CHLR|nr:alanine--tRNA ligase [Dehalogenimonas etheniformans]PPD58136.1 alanine--tRNA ligase [Dehalogenimonas etheniformans]QNT75543.1 alanine--tRNA ligase [Dehalogenimonas etheniformans]
MPFTGDQLRALFLEYFAEKAHKILPSSSLIPHGDPTLLLTTAGMVQFKPYFLGKEKPPASRLTTCQKCFRTTDIDSVGDASHLTFFEMLGNFSIGDYFKKEAIDFAWEFVTQRLKIPADRLWTTVYLDDDEAVKFWQAKGVQDNRIVRLGEKDNFWGPAGDSGPCGPCSEIHYDFGEGVGCRQPDCGPACKCGRFCEIWNLVFVQFDQDKSGSRIPLKNPSIDTGMGLERLTTIMQGKSGVYQTDRFDYLLDKVATVSGKKYGSSPEIDRAMRIVAEHSRSITFLIADGVIPSNEGRGYVLRRLLRRTALFGRNLGLDKPFMVPLVETVIERMSPVYPELAARRNFITELVAREESRFAETLITGMRLLEEMMVSEAALLRRKITGEQAFKLYDTYGFPLDLTSEISSAAGFEVDAEGFNYEMSQQKEKARASHKFELSKEAHARHSFSTTCFTGYDTLSQYATVDGILKNNSSADVIREGEEGGLILDKTAFYAEMGGQVGDIGEITSGESSFIVTNTVALSPGVVLHQGYLSRGEIKIGDEALARVDVPRRYDIARNHTATHLLQAALREVLGQHVQQRGSVVDPDRLRFDFSHLKAVSAEEIASVEDIINEHIRENHPVAAVETSYQQALKTGVTALFGEKYGETVRVLSIGADQQLSAELCGGTHIKTTGEIGFFKIVAESSVGAGLRRIEAVTGRGAEAFVRQQVKLLNDKTRDLQTEIENGKSQVDVFKKELARKDALSLLSAARPIKGGKLLVAAVGEADIDTLRDMADILRDRLAPALIVLGSTYSDKPVFLCVVAPELVSVGYHAGSIIKRLSEIAGGGGGGRPNLAQGGGRDATKLAAALDAVNEFIK